MKGEACVWRPGCSDFLEPLPVEECEKLIRLRFKPWKYGTPPLDPGFAWGSGGVGDRQLAVAILMDHTGDRKLTALEAKWFTDVFEVLDTLSWEMPAAWIDELLADRQRLRSAGRLRCCGDGLHTLPVR